MKHLLRNIPKEWLRFKNNLSLFVIITLVFSSCREDIQVNEPVFPIDNKTGIDSNWNYDPQPYNLNVPASLPPLPDFPDNPLTEGGVKLGRMLFYDPILSEDSTQSCSSCHLPQHSFTDPRKLSVGIKGIKGKRNAMPIINIAYMDRLFWDGRAISVQDQVHFPIEDPVEMHSTMAEVVSKMEGHPDYPRLVYEAFGETPILPEHVEKSIAQFMRIMLSGDSKFDKVQKGEATLSREEQRGLAIYMSEDKGDCFHCHGDPRSVTLMTDNIFHDNGLDSVRNIYDYEDRGLGDVTLVENDFGKFKTPTLRNVELTAPYMHDGRFATLEEVIDFYSEEVHNSVNIAPVMVKDGSPQINLTETEKSQLIAFLKTLTDESFTTREELQNPFK